jgi:hypothetical protein
MVDDDECEAVSGMKIGRENRSTWRKPGPVPLCSRQIPHDLGSNPGLCCGKLATNRLIYGTAMNLYLRTFKKRTIRIYEHCTVKLTSINLTIHFLKKNKLNLRIFNLTHSEEHIMTVSWGSLSNAPLYQRASSIPVSIA